MTYQPLPEPFEYRPPTEPGLEPPAPAQPEIAPWHRELPVTPARYTNSDKVEQASIDSFPASDPPGYGTGHA